MSGLSKAARASLGYVAGCAAIVLGVAIEFGIGYGLIVGGAATAASFLVLVDADDDDTDGEVPR